MAKVAKAVKVPLLESEFLYLNRRHGLERPHPNPNPAHEGRERIAKRDVWDFCEAFFIKYDYDIKYLKKCDIEIVEGKAPKELKAKAGRRLLWLG